LVAVIEFLVADGDREVGNGILLLPEFAAQEGGAVEGGFRVLQGLDGAGIELVEVGVPVERSQDLGGIDIEGNDAIGEAERVESGVGTDDGADDGLGFGDELGEFDDGGSVDPLNPGVGGVGVDGRQDGIAGDPVEVSAGGGAVSPV